MAPAHRRVVCAGASPVGQVNGDRHGLFVTSVPAPLCAPRTTLDPDRAPPEDRVLEISRRGLLAALVVTPLAIAAGRLVEGVDRATPLLRPGSDGSSAARCGRCGAPDHGMLSPDCPSAPRLSAGRR
jgi:hypothetical protein